MRARSEWCKKVQHTNEISTQIYISMWVTWCNQMQITLFFSLLFIHPTRHFFFFLRNQKRVHQIFFKKYKKERKKKNEEDISYIQLSSHIQTQITLWRNIGWQIKTLTDSKEGWHKKGNKNMFLESHEACTRHFTH